MQGLKYSDLLHKDKKNPQTVCGFFMIGDALPGCDAA